MPWVRRTSFAQRERKGVRFECRHWNMGRKDSADRRRYRRVRRRSIARIATPLCYVSIVLPIPFVIDCGTGYWSASSSGDTGTVSNRARQRIRRNRYVSVCVCVCVCVCVYQTVGSVFNRPWAFIKFAPDRYDWSTNLEYARAIEYKYRASTAASLSKRSNGKSARAAGKAASPEMEIMHATARGFISVAF